MITPEIAHKIKNIAGNIRSIRESKGYTQEYLAMKLGISQNAYSKIELGYTKITLDRFFHIAKLIETDAFTLIDISERNSTLTLEHPRAASM